MEITPLIVFWEGNLWGNNTLLFGEVSLKVRFGAKTCNILRINSWEKNKIGRKKIKHPSFYGSILEILVIKALFFLCGLKRPSSHKSSTKQSAGDRLDG